MENLLIMEKENKILCLQYCVTYTNSYEKSKIMWTTGPK